MRRVLEKPRACSACRRSVGGQRRAAFPAWGACPWQRPEVPSMSGLGGDLRPHPRASSWHGVQGGQWAPSARRHCSLLPPEVGMKRTESPNRSQGAGGAEPSPGAQGSQSTQPPGPSVQALAVDPLFRSDAPHGHRGPGHTLPSLWGPLSAPWRLNQPHLSVHLGQGGRTHPRRLLKPRLCGELSESSGRAPRGPLGAGRKLRLVCSPQRQRSAPDAGTPPCPPTLCLAQGWHRGTHGVAG